MNNKGGVSSLNLCRSKLISIPKDVMKNKDSLIELDISGNLFRNFDSVLEDLKKLKKLKKLRINIYTQEQAKKLIDSMPNLEFLNDEPIYDDDLDSAQNNINECKEEEYEEEIIINIPSYKLIDKTFDPVFNKLCEFYNINKEKEEEFQKIIEDFNNLCRNLKICKNNNNIENLSINEIKKKLQLYIFLYNILNQIKDQIKSNKIQYKANSVILLSNIMEENEKIKNKCEMILNFQNQNEIFNKTKRNNIKVINNQNNLKNKNKINNKRPSKQSIKIRDNNFNQEYIFQKRLNQKKI